MTDKKYEIFDEWDIHSPIRVAQRDKMLAPTVNVKTDSFFDKLVICADNIVDIFVKTKTEFFPDSFIESYTMLSHVYSPIKDFNGALSFDIWSDESIDILCEVYLIGLNKCILEFVKEVNAMQSDFILNYTEAKYSDDTVQCIKTMLTTYYSKQNPQE
jgi:hypothetical protein